MFKQVFNRLTTFAVLILLQVILLVVVVFRLSSYGPVIYGGLEFLSIVIVIWVMVKNINPIYKLAWCVAILLFPLTGGVFYLLWGNKRLPKKVREKAGIFSARYLKDEVRDARMLSALAGENNQLGTIATYVDEVAGFPIWSNTEMEYYAVGESMYVRMLEELRLANSYIFMEYFIIKEGIMWNSILSILKEKAAAGVRVLLIYDDVGCINTLPADYDKTLRDFGIRATVFNPMRPRANAILNYRDHRKITVIDGKVAFCGGANLADEYINEIERFGHWKDTAAMIRGEGVWNLTETFLRLWNFEVSDPAELEDILSYRHDIISAKPNGYVQPFSDSPLDEENVSENFFLNVINKATDYVYITTPYLVIANELQTALCLAAKNGVDVRLITPGIPDKKYVYSVTQSYYPSLLASGVRIYEYSPGFLHAKTVLSDDQVGLIGTVNMDYRSFYFHFECGIIFYNTSILQDIKDDLIKTMDISREITLAEAKATPLPKRMIRMLLKVFSPLM